MKPLTFPTNGTRRIGALTEGVVLDLSEAYAQYIEEVRQEVDAGRVADKEMPLRLWLFSMEARGRSRERRKRSPTSQVSWLSGMKS